MLLFRGMFKTGVSYMIHVYVQLNTTRYVPRNMGMPPACKVCMSYTFHAYTINKSNVSTNTFQIKNK